MPKVPYRSNDPLHTAEVYRLFESNIVKLGLDNCWIWVGKCTGTDDTYGAFYCGKVKGFAHRISYQLWVGPIPPKMFVCHRCDIPLCVNPRHLFVGTAHDNTQDMMRKGRYVVGSRYFGDDNVSRKKTYLLTKGEEHWKHKLTPENVKEIVALCSSGHEQSEVAEIFNVQQAAISKIMRGINWRHVTGFCHRTKAMLPTTVEYNGVT